MTAAASENRHPKKRAVLAALSRVGIVTEACRSARVDRSTYYDWLKDGDFAAAAAAAIEEAGDRLEAEARRRAEKGWLRPVFQGGRKVGTVLEKSDTLLIFLLKGAKPEKYRERFRHVIEDPDKVLASLLGVDPGELPA